MNLEQIKKDVIQDLNDGNECAVASNVKRLIRNIVTEQARIKDSIKTIQECQKTLKEMQLPTAISTDVLG